MTGPAAAAALLLTARDERRSAFLWVVVDDGAGGAGARLAGVAGPDGRVELSGTLGDPDLDRAAAGLGERALGRDGGVAEGVHRLRDQPPLDAYLEVHHPDPELVVVGAGHIARPLAEMGTLLGMEVTVLDDRPDFATRERFPRAARVERVDFADPFAGVPVHRGTHVVLVTRGHRYDYEALRRLLAHDPEPAYLGMIGSRRRVRATYAKLVEEGADPERLARVRAPVGLDLGAETPAEIAVAVAAEIVLGWRGGSGAPLRDVERVMERFFGGGTDS